MFEHFLSAVDGAELSGPWSCDRCGTRAERRGGRWGPYGLERAPDRQLCRSCVQRALDGGSVLTVEEELEELGVEYERRLGGGARGGR